MTNDTATEKTYTDYISQKTSREPGCGCHQPGTGGVGFPCQTGNYFDCIFCLNSSKSRQLVVLGENGGKSGVLITDVLNVQRCFMGN